ncbi:uncharacterized protein O3C94_008269 [Discoglossus pictus]
MKIIIFSLLISFSFCPGSANEDTCEAEGKNKLAKIKCKVIAQLPDCLMKLTDDQLNKLILTACDIDKSDTHGLDLIANMDKVICPLVSDLHIFKDVANNDEIRELGELVRNILPPTLNKIALTRKLISGQDINAVCKTVKVVTGIIR